MDASSHAVESTTALIGLQQVGLGHDDEGGGAVPRRWSRSALNAFSGLDRMRTGGVLVVDDIDDVDEAGIAHTPQCRRAQEPDQVGRFGQPRGLNEDGIQVRTGCDQAFQSRLQSAGIGHAAQAAARDGGRLIDLAGHQGGIDVDVAEIIDDDAQASPRSAQKMVEKRRLAGTEVTGERNDGNAGPARRSSSRSHSAADVDRACAAMASTASLKAAEVLEAPASAVTWASSTL